MVVGVSGIFLATHEFYPQRGGIATFTEELATALGGSGETVTVLAPRATRNPRDKEGIYTLVSLGFPPDHGWRATVGMARELVRRRDEIGQGVLCITEPGPLWALYLAARFYGFRAPRLWVVLHGSEIVRGSRSRSWRRVLESAFSSAERIATVSTYTQNLLVRDYGLSRERVSVLAMGAPTWIRRAGSLRLSKERCASGKLVVLTVGRLHPRKGQDLMLMGLSRLDPDLLAGMEYRIVGAGRRAGYGRRLRRMAADLRVPVTFAGPLDDQALIEEYAQADIFALTSREHRHSLEGFGLVYLEAGSFGLPVLAARSGGTSDAVRPDETGFLVPEGDIDAIAVALDQLLRDPLLRQRLGKAGKAFAHQRSWDAVAQCLQSGSHAYRSSNL